MRSALPGVFAVILSENAVIKYIRGEMSMEKNRIKPVKSGKSSRMSYSRKKEVLEMPNLIEVQRDSYQWFLDEGLREAFADISPITDYSGKLSLEFTDFTLEKENAKNTTFPRGSSIFFFVRFL